ncbi:hypothetical protein G5I_13093 [Acromyrmex echinatior]|uniref:Uncharacterized protein n=1 Tax=Acromyrmex echinatior TaxID=103372 RepID=F4X443_ACREC|nr:hypothetical protein G5I_13093 [Acromyrmex echinatior]
MDPAHRTRQRLPRRKLPHHILKNYECASYGRWDGDPGGPSSPPPLISANGVTLTSVLVEHFDAFAKEIFARVTNDSREQIDVTMDGAGKRANEDSVLEHEHEYAKRRNGPGLSPDKAASVSISVFLPDNATRAHQVSHNLSDNKYGPTDRAPFIVHMQVSSDCITENAFEVLMKRQVAKIMRSGIIRDVPTSVTDQELKLNLKSSCPVTEKDLTGALLKKAMLNTSFPPRFILNLLGRSSPGKYFFSTILTRFCLLSLESKRAFLASGLATSESFVRVEDCVIRMLTERTRHKMQTSLDYRTPKPLLKVLFLALHPNILSPYVREQMSPDHNPLSHLRREITINSYRTSPISKSFPLVILIITLNHWKKPGGNI